MVSGASDLSLKLEVPYTVLMLPLVDNLIHFILTLKQCSYHLTVKFSLLLRNICADIQQMPLSRRTSIRRHQRKYFYDPLMSDL